MSAYRSDEATRLAIAAIMPAPSATGPSPATASHSTRRHSAATPEAWRRDSPTHCRWFAVELTAENRRSLYVPPGFAHGFQTLLDDTEILYQMAEPYAPVLARGVRWNDPAFAIDWPIAPPFMSERDATYPDYRA